MNHGTYLSTSVQEMDPASLSNPQCPQLLRELMNVPLCEEQLKHLMVYRPLLDGDGFNFRGMGSSEDEADVHLEASRQLRVSLRQNEEHFKAWGAQESLLTNLSLENDKPMSDGASKPDDHPSLLGNLDASRQFRINRRRNKEHFKAWQTQEFIPTSVYTLDDTCNKPNRDKEGTPHVRGHQTSQEQAKKDKGFDPYTTCLNTILLSDGCHWKLSLDHVMQVMNDVATELVGLHAASTPYGDMHVENIYVTELMRAFLITSDKSRKQENNIPLTEEFRRDMKLFCKIMGGMYNFYIRNKPPEPPEDINKEAEKALTSLLKRGYRDSMSAKDLLEELGQIVVSSLIEDERVEAPRAEPKLEEKKKSGLGQTTGDNAPEPKSEAMDDQSLEVDSRAVKNPGSVHRAASFFDDQGLLPRSAPIDYQFPNQNSGAMDVKDAESVPEPGAVDNVQKPSCEVISTPVPMPEAGAMNYNASEPRSEVVSTSALVQEPGALNNSAPKSSCEPVRIPEALALSMDLSGLGLGAVSNQAPELGPGNEPRDEVSRSLELCSAEAEDNNLDREFSDHGSTHEQLLSDLEMEMYFSASDQSIYYDAGN